MVLIVWLFGALIGVAAAQKKGFSMAAGILGGLLLGPLSFLMFFISGVSGSDKNKKCPYCAEFVKADARICKHCHKEIIPDAVLKARPSIRSILFPLFALGSGFIVGCTNSPGPTRQQAPTPAATSPAPVVSDATAKADALLEDMRRRQAAFEKIERELPKVPPPRLEDYIPRAPEPTPAAQPIAVAVASAQPSAPTPAPAADAKDESWWKNQMRTAEVRLAEDTRRLQHATDQLDMARRQMQAAIKSSPVEFAETQNAAYRANAEVERLQAEVRNDTAAVERVREDARRANVPPGWLRWP